MGQHQQALIEMIHRDHALRVALRAKRLHKSRPFGYKLV